MAYADYGALLPTEALFTEPGAYAGVLKGEALKRASYLSQMDSFYAELDESKRRFDKEYSLAEREFEFESGQATREFDFMTEQAELDREFQTKAFETQTELTREEIEASKLGRGSLNVLWEDRPEDDLGALSETEEFEMATSFLTELEGSKLPRTVSTKEQRDAPISFYNPRTSGNDQLALF